MMTISIDYRYFCVIEFILFNTSIISIIHLSSTQMCIGSFNLNECFIPSTLKSMIYANRYKQKLEFFLIGKKDATKSAVRKSILDLIIIISFK